MSRNPDSRTLPYGWSTYYDNQTGIWMYVNQTVNPPFVTSVHPGAAEPPTAGRGHAPANPPAFINPRIEPSRAGASASAADPFTAARPHYNEPGHPRPPGNQPATPYYPPPSGYGPSNPAASSGHYTTDHYSSSAYSGRNPNYTQGRHYDVTQPQSFSTYQDPSSYNQSAYGPSSTAYTPQQQQNYPPPASTTYQPPAAPYQTGYETRHGATAPTGDAMPPPPPGSRGDYPEYPGSGGRYYG